MTDKFDESLDDKFEKVLETLKQTFGSDNITVINSEEDLANLELQEYLKSGGYLH